MKALSILLVFALNPLHLQASEDPRLTEVKKIMRICGGLTKEGDVDHRHLSQDVALEFGDNCVEQKPRQDSLSYFNQQITTAFEGMDENRLLRGMNETALHTTAKAIWNSHKTYINKVELTEDSARKMICDRLAGMCQDKSVEKNLHDAWLEFSAETKKTPVKFFGDSQVKILDEQIRPAIKKANIVCAETKKKYDELQTQYSCSTPIVLGKPHKPMTLSQCQARSEALQGQLKLLEKEAAKKIAFHTYEALDNESSPLFILPSLQKRLGAFDKDLVYSKCMAGPGVALNDLYHADLIKARAEYHAEALSELKVIRNDNPDKLKLLKEFLKNNPGSVAEYLTKNPSQDDAYALCGVIKDIYKRDRIESAIKTAGTIVALTLLTVATAGGGTVLAGTVLGSSLLAAGISGGSIVGTMSLMEYQEMKKAQNLARKAVITKQRSPGSVKK